MKYIVGSFIALVLIGMFVVSPVIAYTTRAEVDFTVKDKERICSGGESGTCKYLVYTDNGVYQNTDSLWYFKFNSSDIYGALDAGTTYRASVYGFRVPFLSWYKNIIEAHAI